MATFNPEQFEQTAIKGENATTYIPIPEDDYTAYIENYTFQVFPRDGEENVALNINWVIPDDILAKELNLEELRVRQTIWLDFMSPGVLDLGTNKNVNLGRLRAALSLNSAKKPFQWADLTGKQGRITVSQRADKNDATVIYNSVKRVSPAEAII